MAENEKNESPKQKYYEIIDVKFPSYEKGRDEFNAKINAYEQTHEVLHRNFSMVWSNGSFVWTMVFCCEHEGYEQQNPSLSRSY